jgi:dipeptidyl aminopeptidase/acylaminoacyl peptidase
MSLPASGADEPIDRTGGWDVNGPLGPPQQTLTMKTNEGTWMNLDAHPDGSAIIFDLLGDLYLLPIGGGDAIRLTEGAAFDFQPRFSPDGGQVLFTSDRGGIFSVWLADFDGTALSALRNLNETASNTWVGANWTADGEWILAKKRVTDTSSIGVSELWMLHKDGGSGVQLVAPKAEVDSFHASPDGRYIYFGAAPPFSYGRSPYGQIWSVNRYDRVTGEQRPVRPEVDALAAQRGGRFRAPAVERARPRSDRGVRLAPHLPELRLDARRLEPGCLGRRQNHADSGRWRGGSGDPV